jgi:hypothetical protein
LIFFQTTIIQKQDLLLPSEDISEEQDIHEQAFLCRMIWWQKSKQIHESSGPADFCSWLPEVIYCPSLLQLLASSLLKSR